MAVIRQVCDTEPTPIVSLNPDIPIWLEGLIRKLHAKDPAQRFASAGEVADLLERCLAHVQQPDRQSLPALADELGRRVQCSPVRQRRRHALWAAALAAAILGTMTLCIALRPTKERETVSPSESEALASLFWDEQLNEDSSQLRARLETLSQSFALPNNSSDPELTFAAVRQRIETLKREWSTSQEWISDPIEVQAQSIRRRLEQVKKSLGVGPE